MFNFLESGYGVRTDSAPISTDWVVSQWIKEKELEVSPSTLNFYRQTADSFLKYLGDRAQNPMEEISRHDLVEFRGELAANLSAKTVNHRIKTLRMFFEWALKDHLVTENRAKQVRNMRTTTQCARRPFTVSEIHLILSLADPEWQSMIRFGIYTGQRLGDISRMDWRQVDWQLGILRMVTAKTQRSMVIPIHRRLLGYLFLQWSNAGCNNFGPIHPRAKSTVLRCEGRVTSLSNQFVNILFRAGLRQRVSHAETGRGKSTRRCASELSFHSLRHSAVSFLRQAGVSQAVAMELVGHDSIEISRHYTHVGIEALRSATSALPKV